MKYLWMAIILTATSLSLSTQAHAQSKKINTRRLIEDYWTPQKKKYALIQKRYYVKAKRPMLSLTAGTHVNNPQHEGYLGTLSLGYYFTEKWGVEGHISASSLKSNDVIDALANEVPSGSSTLNRGKTKSYIGGSLNFSPIYAKMSLLGYKILYFDLILSGHLGQTKYEQTLESNSKTATALTYGLGISQIFYLNRHWSVRFDLINRWYNSEVLDYNSPHNKVKDRLVNDTLLNIGVSLML